MPLLIKNGLVLPSAHSEPRTVDILVDGALISNIGRDLYAPEGVRVIDAEGHLVIPGLINAHTHGRENLLKGLIDNRPLEPWLLQLAALTDERSPEDQYVSVALGAVEMLKHGVTAAYELFTNIPTITPEAVAAVLGAYRDVGLRAVVAPCVADIPYHRTIPGLVERLEPSLINALDGLFPARVGSDLLDVVEQSVADWKIGTGEDLVRLALAPVIPERCTDAFLVACRDLAKKLNLPIHTHLLETKIQAVERFRRDGCSTPTVLDRLGLLTETSSLAHAIWVTPGDIELIGQRGCGVVHNPVSNLKLGSGIMPMRKMMDQHIHLAIGTDGCASADHQNIFEAIRLAAYIHRPSEPDYDAWPVAAEVLEAAWEGGAYALGFGGRLGRIEPGYLADIVLLDLDSEGLTPLNNAANQLVLCENGRAVRTVIVNGRIVLDQGEPTMIEAKSIRARARESARRLSRNIQQSQIVSRVEPALKAARSSAIATPSNFIGLP
ncbi:MAG: amidohydrolase family protein [Pseudolabrys sp.]|jgi:5-methylthioadenosine/S-adenosylhomocysteine deaminase